MDTVADRPAGNSYVRADMKVLSADGTVIGRITRIGETEIVVERSERPTICVPWHALDVMCEVPDDCVALDIPADQVDEMGWVMTADEVITPASRFRPLMQKEQEVVGSDGEHVGYVDSLREDDFLIERSLKRDIYVPFDVISEVTQFQVVLTLSVAEVEAREWPSPPLIDLGNLMKPAEDQEPPAAEGI